MSLFKNFKANDEIEKGGVWVEYDVNADNTTPAFRVARISKTNVKYQKALERRMKPIRRSLTLGTITEKESQRLYREVFLDAILLDWKNIKDENEEGILFSKENARKLFEDLPELFLDLQEKASDVSLFREEQKEDDAKN